MRTLVLVAGVLLVAHRARAECAITHGAVFPAGGALPPHPTLYRFEPADQAPAAIRVVGRDGPVGFTTRDVSVTDAIRITAIHVDAGSGPIELVGGDGEPAHRYLLAPQPAPAAPALDRITAVSEAWSCSYAEGIAIELRAPGVAAFRARWSDGAEAIVAPNDRAYWATPDFPADPEQAHVFLGHVSCAGEQIPSRYLGRRDFTLTAIYPDETSHEIALPRAPVGATVERVIEPAPPRTAPPVAPRWPWIAALSAASVAFVIALVGRRRRAMVV